MRRSPLVLVLSAFLPALLAACSSTSSTTTTSTESVYPTSIAIEPSNFLGDVPCANAEGAMRSYVATLRDVTDPNSPFDLPSSPAVSCSGQVTFLQVLEEHTYRVEIDGYDVDASDLVPLGGISSGSRTMVRRDDPSSATVSPVWGMWCSPVLASYNVRQVPSECFPDPDMNPAGVTGIRVDPNGALVGTATGGNADLVCRAVDDQGNPTGAGDVASFDIVPHDPSLPSLVNVGCGSSAAKPPPYTQGVSAGKVYSFRVEARAEAGGPVVWGSECSALAVDKLIVKAACNPLSTNGSVEISLDDVLESAALACGETGVAMYDVALIGPTALSASHVPCEKPVFLGPVSPGSYVATVVGLGASGEEKLKASCAAEVAPGAVTLASCQLL